MSTPSVMDQLDLDLREALRARTATQPDDARLLATILSTTVSVAQDRRGWWIRPWPRPLLAASVVLLALTVVTAILAATLLRPAPPLPNNGLIVVAQEGRVAAFDPIDGAAVASPLLDRLGLTSYRDAAWSPSGDALAVSTDPGVRVTGATGSSSFFGECRLVGCPVAWFPDGTLAVGSGSRIDRVDPTQGIETILVESVGEASIAAVAVDSAGIATGLRGSAVPEQRRVIAHRRPDLRYGEVDRAAGGILRPGRPDLGRRRAVPRGPLVGRAARAQRWPGRR